MAYSTGNPPALVYQTVGGGFKKYAWQSTASVATVAATTYITNGRDLGMRINDLVEYRPAIAGSTVVVLSKMLAVISTSTNGSVSLSTGTALGSTST